MSDNRLPSGGWAAPLTPEQELRRLVLANLLWEDNAYESGVSIAARICVLVPMVDAAAVADLAVEARERMMLRHVPLLLVREMSKHPTHKPFVAGALERVVQRADELAEFLALYWQAEGRDRRREPRVVAGREKNAPLAKQVKVGLSRAFQKFDEYQLAKYDRSGPARLRDVLFLTHPEPRPTLVEGMPADAGRVLPDGRLRHETGQGGLWQRLAQQQLTTPDTWEVQLSAGADKRATFERLIGEGKLGALALLRNLRGMTEAGVPAEVISGALEAADVSRVLPFQIYAAFRHAAQFREPLEALLLRSARNLPRLGGRTALVIDVSGSMATPLSAKSQLTRLQAAAALASIVAEICDEGHVYASGSATGLIEGGATSENLDGYWGRPRRGGGRSQSRPMAGRLRGMRLATAVEEASLWAGGGGIYTRKALEFVASQEPAGLDRVVVLTDGQDCDTTAEGRRIPDIAPLQYTINVAAHRNGVAYSPSWLQIDGWSDHVVRYLAELEALMAPGVAA
jgi:60 kDa SS-A/Ro ribonucleoprotein